MFNRGAAGVHAARIDQRTEFAQRPRQVVVAPSVDRRHTCVTSGQSKDHPRSGGLAASIGTEESGDDTGLDLEREIINDRATAVPLGQTAYFDHGKIPSLQNARTLNSRTPSTLERHPESALKTRSQPPVGGIRDEGQRDVVSMVAEPTTRVPS